MANIPRTRDEPDEDEMEMMEAMSKDGAGKGGMDRHMMMMMGGMNRKPRWMIPNRYNQFKTEVTEELYDEYYARLESGDITPEGSKVWKRTWNGGPYDSERKWDQDWNWCIDHLGYTFDNNCWPMDHPNPKHPWNTNREKYLLDLMDPDPDDV